MIFIQSDLPVYCSEDLKVHSWDGRGVANPGRVLPQKKGSHVTAADCVGARNGDARKKSGDTLAIGTSDGDMLIFHVCSLVQF